jgi:glycosyltransferase involved in cell wall biosynthesis
VASERGPLNAPGTDVVRIITRLNIGGPARQELMLSNALQDRFRTVLAAGVPSPDEGELSDPRVEVRRLPLVRPLSFRYDLSAFVATRALLRLERPRLVHTHMAKAGAIGRAAALTLRPRPKLVHTFHGHVLEGYFRPGTERLFIRTERALARRTDAIVAVSDEVRDTLLALGVGRPDQYRVISLGLDLDPFLRIEKRTGALRDALGIGPGVPLIGIVGRLVPIKDHEMLFDAIGRLPEVHLAVIGDGESRTEVEERARATAPGRIHFTGWRHDMPETLADLDVVALSSRNEGTPVALIEALAAGVPVAATDVGGVRGVVEDPVRGLLVPAGDAPRMAAALEELLARSSKRIPGEERAVVGAKWGRERLIREMGDLYSELLRSG